MVDFLAVQGLLELHLQILNQSVPKPNETLQKFKSLLAIVEIQIRHFAVIVIRVKVVLFS